MSTISEDIGAWNSSRRLASAEDGQEDGPIISRTGAAGHCQRMSVWRRQARVEEGHRIIGPRRHEYEEEENRGVNTCVNRSVHAELQAEHRSRAAVDRVSNVVRDITPHRDRSRVPSTSRH